MKWGMIIDNVLDFLSYLVVAVMVLALPVGIIIMIIVWIVNLIS